MKEGDVVSWKGNKGVLLKEKTSLEDILSYIKSKSNDFSQIPLDPLGLINKSIVAFCGTEGEGLFVGFVDTECLKIASN